MSEGTLFYFPLHFRAGPSRMLLKHKGIEYENKMIPQEEWPAIKETMPGGSMPIWQATGSELKLSQSMAILHHLGFKYDYLAKHKDHVWRQEHAIECFNDFERDKSCFAAMKPEIGDEEVEKFKKAVSTLLSKLNEV